MKTPPPTFSLRIMDCGGRAKRRHRFGFTAASRKSGSHRPVAHSCTLLDHSFVTCFASLHLGAFALKAYPAILASINPRAVRVFAFEIRGLSINPCPCSKRFAC